MNLLNVESNVLNVKAVNAANATLGMIRRSFVNREKQTIMTLHKSVVRPKLEHCIQAWRPHLTKDIELMERVQQLQNSTAV